MGGGDTLDSFVSNYPIGIRGKKWRWPNFINTTYVLKSAAFKINKMANLESNIDFLQFIRRNQIHYLRVAEISRQMRAKNIHPCKQSWKGVCAVTQNERPEERYFIENLEPIFSDQEPIYKVDLCMEPCFRSFHANILVF